MFELLRRDLSCGSGVKILLRIVSHTISTNNDICFEDFPIIKPNAWSVDVTLYALDTTSKS